MNRFYSILTCLAVGIHRNQVNKLDQLRFFSGLIASKMKAVKQDGVGSVDTMYIAEFPLPDVKENQVLVKSCSSAINRADLLMRMGKYPNQKDVMKLGLEVSGTIVKLGEGVKGKWKLNENVMALLPGGGYAEYVAVNERHLMELPQSLLLLHAGGIPEVWLTAYQLLHFVGKLQPNDTVLIHGAGSGVGTAAIQLAKLHGAKSIATAGSKEKIDKATSLGAEVGYNYKTEEFDQKVLEFTNGTGIDIVLDCVGATYWKKNLKCLKRDGRWVLYGLLGGGIVDGNILSQILAKRISLTGTTLMSRSDDYKAELISEFSQKALPHFGTKLFPVIDKVYPLEEVINAHKYLESNQNIGKVLLDIHSDG